MPAKVSQKAPREEQRVQISCPALSGEIVDKSWKLTKSAEYNKGERITNDPLANRSEYHEDAAEEEIGS